MATKKPQKADNESPAEDLIFIQSEEPPRIGNHLALLFGPIEDATIQEIIQWIIIENLSPNPVPELKLMINSEGGDLAAAYALIEVMGSSRIPISTVAMGQCASAGLFIFMAGTKGRRIATPTVEFLSHHFSTTNSGNYHELKNSQIAYERIDKKILEHYRAFTGLPEKTIREKLICNHDVYLTPQEAVKLKLADKVGPVTF